MNSPKSVRTGAEKINLQKKGYTAECLVKELNKKEEQDFIEREKDGRGYLRRYYLSIPNNTDSFRVESVASNIHFNIKDAKNILYNPNDDTLCLTNRRCTCSVCLTTGFLGCDKPHQIHRFKMTDVVPTKSFPDPESFSDFTDGCQESPDVCVSEKDKTSVLQPQEKPHDLTTSSAKIENIAMMEDQSKIMRKKFVDEAGASKIKMIDRNDDHREICLPLTRQEKKQAKEEIRQWEIRNETLSPFDRARQYECGDIDFVINRFRGSGIQNAKPMRRLLHQDYECMSPSTFNELIKRVLNQPSATAEEIMMNALRPEDLKRALPSSQDFRVLLIGLYGSRTLRRRTMAGKFGFGNSDDPGHFIVCRLDISSSEVIFYDTMNQNIQSSLYFDYPLIIKTLKMIHDFYRIKRNMENCEMTINQQLLQKQRGLNCGCHLLLNLELLLSNENPAEMSFNDDTIKDIRRYQFLLRHTDFDEYRLKLE